MTKKVNLIIGDSPPPGAVIFNPDGTIGRTPDSPEARHRWIIQKMTLNIQREPQNGEWYAERSTAYMKLGLYPEAISDLDKLIELEPSWTTAYHFRGICHFYIGNKQNAWEDLKDFKNVVRAEYQDKETIRIIDELEKEIKQNF